MHLSSIEKMTHFRRKYLSGREGEPLNIVDLGSVSIGGNYRSLFDSPNWRYTGIDLTAGDNVDIVLSDPYSWVEIPTASIDVLISGQAFEHIAFFWKTMREIDRILKPGALCCLIAPSGGPEHRYPIDCWRFYPDGFRVLANYVDFDVLDVGTDWAPKQYADDSHLWADTMLVARKPETRATVVNLDSGRHVYNREIDEAGEDSLAKIIPHIPEGAEVLELGPATGYLTRHLKNRLNCQVDAVEISPEMAAQARPFCRDMFVADVEKTNLVDLLEGRTYDRIVIADVLEHLSDGRNVTRDCHQLLKKDGKCLISVPNIGHAAIVGSLLRERFDYTMEGLLDRTHLRFYTRRSIVRLLERAGFFIERIETVQKLPEDTEIDDSLTDFSPEVQQAIFSRPDALTYQFIVTCRRGDVEAGDQTDDVVVPGNNVIDLRRKFIQQQSDLIRQLYDKTNRVEKDYRKIETDYRKLEKDYRHVEKLALTRLDTIGAMRRELDEARHLNDEQSEHINLLTKQNEQLDGALSRIRSSRLYKVYRLVSRLYRSARDRLS